MNTHEIMVLGERHPASGGREAVGDSPIWFNLFPIRVLPPG